MNLMQSFKDFWCLQGPKKTYWIALSGGLDSQVLLLLCHQLRSIALQDIALRAIHINHGLNPQADLWAKECKTLCLHYDIPFVEHKLRLKLKAGESIEAAAREARYAAFCDYLEAGDMLLTAHHQDDQAETLLLQLLRGAGLKGLSAMPEVKPLGAGLHARPLLSIERQTLETYAKAHGLNWIEDEMNADSRLTRNFIRQAILPSLKSRWPTVSATIARSAKHCADAQLLLDEFAEEILTAVAGSVRGTLSVAKLLQLSPHRQQLILRAWIYQQGFQLPSTKKLIAIQKNVLTSAWDRLPCVNWQKVEVRRHKDNLYLMKSLEEVREVASFEWHLNQPVSLSNGCLFAELVKGEGFSAEIQTVSVKYRQGGEVLQLGQRGRQKLKNLFQEWQVLPWERDCIPLIFVGEELVAVPGYFMDEKWCAKQNEWGWKWQWQRNEKREAQDHSTI